jgi:hypothetical protein
MTLLSGRGAFYEAESIAVKLILIHANGKNSPSPVQPPSYRHQEQMTHSSSDLHQGLLDG